MYLDFFVLLYLAFLLLGHTLGLDLLDLLSLGLLVDLVLPLLLAPLDSLQVLVLVECLLHLVHLLLALLSSLVLLVLDVEYLLPELFGDPFLQPLFDTPTLHVLQEGGHFANLLLHLVVLDDVLDHDLGGLVFSRLGPHVAVGLLGLGVMVLFLLVLLHLVGVLLLENSQLLVDHSDILDGKLNNGDGPVVETLILLLHYQVGHELQGVIGQDELHEGNTLGLGLVPLSLVLQQLDLLDELLVLYVFG